MLVSSSFLVWDAEVIIVRRTSSTKAKNFYCDYKDMHEEEKTNGVIWIKWITSYTTQSENLKVKWQISKINSFKLESQDKFHEKKDPKINTHTHDEKLEKYGLQKLRILGDFQEYPKNKQWKKPRLRFFKSSSGRFPKIVPWMTLWKYQFFECYYVNKNGYTFVVPFLQYLFDINRDQLIQTTIHFFYIFKLDSIRNSTTIIIRKRNNRKVIEVLINNWTLIVQSFQ